jgi:hypothetical protein
MKKRCSACESSNPLLRQPEVPELMAKVCVGSNVELVVAPKDWPTAPLLFCTTMGPGPQFAKALPAWIINITAMAAVAANSIVFFMASSTLA